jgi:hypothetical protein
MLKCFCGISYAGRYEELFSGTDIYDENLAYRTRLELRPEYSNI